MKSRSAVVTTLVGLVILAATIADAANHTLQFNGASVSATIRTETRSLTVQRAGKVVQTITLGRDLGSSVSYEEIANGFKLRNSEGEEIEVIKDVDEQSFSLFTVARRARGQSKVVVDCVRIAGSNWYGGPQQKYQYWPIQKLRFNEYSYITKEADNCAVGDRYWLNSLGSFVYVDDRTPLFVDQNYGEPGYLCLEAKKVLPYEFRESTYSFIYKVGVASDAKEAHLGAVKHILGKPTGHPAEAMVKYPVWSTWARYKRDIDHKVVLEFADEIVNHGWRDNQQFELDDDWEKCYGALEFNTTKFPAIRDTISAIRAKGFPRVTIWIHPFINKGCEPIYSEAKRLGYLATDHTGNPDTQWWNSKTAQAAYVDFTKPEVQQWFTQRLQAVLDVSGIDSFKFDAGESSWSPPDPVQVGPAQDNPNHIVYDYLRTVAKFGDLVEVRTAHATQDLPVYVRMIDKDSEWTWNNGLPTLITTLLEMNMVGYPLVLPDMVGGNGYNGAPSKEMFIRWLQANVFMPSIQFSYVPWDYDAETVTISKAMTDLHEKYTDKIMERFRLAVSDGLPVNPPLWWVSPDDTDAQKIYDQFLLGDDIIAAPVIRQNARARDIYLPAGVWEDGNSKVVHTGPKWIYNYTVPLSMLPYFVRSGK